MNLINMMKIMNLYAETSIVIGEFANPSENTVQKNVIEIFQNGIIRIFTGARYEIAF
jgi:hypothetical protein